MLSGKKFVFLLTLLAMMIITMSSAQAKFESTEEVLQSSDRFPLVQVLERQDVQQQLIMMGVDPGSAKERVNQMTDSEVSKINGRLEELPAGAGLSTVDLLLIVILLLII